MNYQISIKGMHCKGCSNLIKMSLEDEGLQQVEIDLQTEQGSFTSDQDAKPFVDKAFAGMPGYDYQDLRSLN